MTPAADAPPFGIAERHLAPSSRRWARAALAVVLGVPLIAAMLGYLGGDGGQRIGVTTPAATLAIDAPRIVRSGNWFEQRIVAVPARDVAALTVAFDRPLWNRLSIDTLAPDAEKAGFSGGAFRYAFGPVAAGERFELKLDGQIQSWGFRHLAGDVTLLDGERPLARVPLAITVLP